MQRIALKVAGVYFFVTGCWIFFSDKVLAFLVHDPATITHLSIAKGWLFTVVTALMLYWLVHRDLKKISISRDFYLKIFEDFPALIWRAGIDGKCDHFNQTWLSFTGRSLEQEMGDGWVQGVHPDDLHLCLSIYTEAFRSRRPFWMEYRLRRHDGEYRWIADYGRPLYGLEEEFAGYIGSCYDVTDRKGAEEEIAKLNRNLEQRAVELERANKQLLLANDELEAFNYSVSHDLRGPLTNIHSTAQLVLTLFDTELSEGVKEYLRTVVNEAERMADLMTALLNLSKISHKELQRVTVDMSQTARIIAASLHCTNPQRASTLL